jgi:3-keto-5-aminohexanoate cleavage enzyme
MNDISGQPVIIEVAVNGAKTRAQQPHVPLTPAEVAADEIACIDAGATIIHNHTGDPVIGGSGAHDAAPYEEAWRAVLAERPNAILYPTMAGGGAHTTVEERYGHIVALAGANVLGMGLVDPGTTNMGRADEDGLPTGEITYQNTYADARYMIDTCRDLAVGISISIFEPGFLRVVLAYHRAGRLPPGAMVKLYFGSGGLLSFGLPPTVPSLDAYLAMLEGTDLPWLVSAHGGGDVVACGLARAAMERGGHVQVGLEPFGGPRTPTNVELIEEAVEVARQLGRPIATADQTAEILGLPQYPIVPRPRG